MIIDKETKAYQTINLYPDSNWTDIPDDELYIVPDGSPLAEKIIENYPYFEFVEQEGQLVDVIPTERPPEPEPEPTLEERVKALEDTQVGQDDLDAMWTQMADAVREGVNEV